MSKQITALAKSNEVLTKELEIERKRNAELSKANDGMRAFLETTKGDMDEVLNSFER
jgi:hypothetical protein